MDSIHKGGRFSAEVQCPHFFTFTKSTIHIYPSFHDICYNWYSKKTWSTLVGHRGGFG